MSYGLLSDKFMNVLKKFCTHLKKFAISFVLTHNNDSEQKYQSDFQSNFQSNLDGSLIKS